MIPFLAKTFLHSNKPSFYDGDSASLLQLVSKIHGALNDVIGEFNKLEENINSAIETFKESSSKDAEVFRVSIRQEFQDFIDVIDVQVKGLSQAIENQNKRFTQIEKDAIASAREIVNGYIASGTFTVGVVEEIDPLYNDKTKITLSIVGMK